MSVISICETEKVARAVNEADYERFDEDHKYLSAKLLTYFIEHPLIFIGYRADDPNIKAILYDVYRMVRASTKDVVPNIYILQWDETITDSANPAREHVIAVAPDVNILGGSRLSAHVPVCRPEGARTPRRQGSSGAGAGVAVAGRAWASGTVAARTVATGAGATAAGSVHLRLSADARQERCAHAHARAAERGQGGRLAAGGEGNHSRAPEGVGEGSNCSRSPRFHLERSGWICNPFVQGGSFSRPLGRR